jgi:8-oxo-dGTP pyrophosphatase MutT (NUDIX family)
MTHTIGVFAALFDDDGRILLVRQSYRGQCWSQPAGRLEVGEAPIDGVRREVLEETGYRCEVTGFIGAYASPWRDDVLLHFRARALSRDPWTPDSEILECGFFAPDALPSPMRTTSRARVADAVAGRSNVFRTFADADSYFDL